MCEHLQRKQTSALSTELEWREFQVHDGKNSNRTTYPQQQPHGFKDAIEAEEDMDFVFSLFENPDKQEYEFFDYPSPKQPRYTLRLRGFSDYTQSTGMALWRGAQVLTEFLTEQRPEWIRHKRVLELGAGLGLSSLVAHAFLQASYVCVTDGDSRVLKNLRYNVHQNTNKRGNGGGMDCPQLIWGRHLEAYAETFGSFDVILASDCVYMTSSLEPLWQTIDRLLVNKDIGGMFLYVNVCASQAPMEKVLEMAQQYHFEWDIHETPSGHSVFVFQRQRDNELDRRRQSF